MQLAEINISRALYPFPDPRMAGFVDNINRINALAERTDGFVWRLKVDTARRMPAAPFNDPMLAINMSVWVDAGALENFVFNTVHKQIYARRAEWFSVMQLQHFVMWHVEDGHVPTLDEAKERLDYFNLHGNSDHAFDWSHLPGVQLWQQARCG